MSKQDRIKAAQEKVDKFVYRGIHDKKRLEELKEELTQAKDPQVSLDGLGYYGLEIFVLSVLALIESGIYLCLK